MKVLIKKLVLLSSVVLVTTQTAFANAPLATVYASALAAIPQNVRLEFEAPTLESLYNQELPANLSMRNRADFFAHLFLGYKTPYKVDPLGEGPAGKYAHGPLYRFDGFDCTTFVETVTALAESSTPAAFEARMNQIRYKDGVVSYSTRNHFTSVDWIPNNIEEGIFQDITEQIAGDATLVSETWIDKAGWYAKKGEPFANLGKNIPRQLAKLNYISKNLLLSDPDIIDRIPSGSVFSLVRPNWNLVAVAGTHMDVSHQGFLIRESDGVLYMIHASNGMGRDGSDDYMGVKKEPLISYIQRVMLKSPSMGGFNILALPDQPLN